MPDDNIEQSESFEIFVINHIIDLMNELESYDEKQIFDKLKEKKLFYLHIKSVIDINENIM